MQTSEDTLALPGFTLDLAQSLLRDRCGVEVRLRPQAMAVLQFLARHAGRVVTKDELMQSVWAGTVVTDDSLVQCVKEIRQALGDHDHRIVRTSPKRGYWLVLSSAAAPSGNGVGANGSHTNRGADPDGAAGGATESATAPAVKSVEPRRRVVIGGAALALGGAGSMAGLSWWLLGSGTTARIQPRAEQPSIVVLPIRNISGGERWDRLARGLTEDITTDLARNHWLFIIASSAAFQRAASGKGAQAIASELGVRFALEGSLQAEGDAVRVNARLLEVARGSSIWSQRWDKQAGQLFDIQDSIVGAIDNSLGSAWTGVIASTDLARARRRSTSSLSAYELFLIGSEHKHRFNPVDAAKARDYFERALKIDPGYAKAWASLGIVCQHLYYSAPDDASRRALLEARRHAGTQAYRADPDDPIGLMEVSWMRSTDGDAAEAEKLLRRAIEVAPNNADVLAQAAWEGATRSPVGEEAIEWAKRSLRLNPNPPGWYHMGLGVSSLYAGHYDQAAEALSKAPDMEFRWRHEIVAQALRGDRAATARALKRLLELAPGASAKVTVGDRGNWGNPKARELFLEGARLAGMPE